MATRSKTRSRQAQAKPVTKTEGKSDHAGSRRTKPALASPRMDILERVSDGFVAFDAQMNYTYVNTRGAELLGRRPADLVGKNYWVEYPEAKGTPFADAYVRALETQTALQIEDYYEQFGRWFENRVYPSEDGLSIFFTDITERKQAEQALRESEEKFREVFESANVGNSITLPSGKLFVNKAFSDLLGYSQEELADKSWQELTPSEDIESIQAILAPLLNGETELARFTKRYVHKNGSIVWGDVSTAIRRGADRKPLYFITTVVDITERKQTEDQLRFSEERFSNAFHTSPAGMTITRISDGKFIDANESFCKMFEFRRAEVIGHTSTELNMWTSEERKKLIRAQLESGGLQDFELCAQSKSGREITILFSSKPMDLEGEACHITTMIDITERKRAEQALRASEEKFSVMFEKAPFVASLSSLPDGRIEEVNEEFENLFGFSREEAVGRTSLELGLYLDPEIRRQAIARVEQSGFRRNAELKLRTKSGEMRDFLVNTDFVEIGEEKHILTTAKDITERKRAQAAIEFQAHLLANVQDAVIATDTKQAITYWNRAAEELYGWKSDEVLGKPAREVIRSEFTDTQRAEAMKALNEIGRHRVEVLQYHRTGTSFWVERSTIAIRDRAGDLTGFISVKRDITERKRAEEALKESEERYRQLLDVSPVGIAVHAEGRLVFANAAGARIIGAKAPEEVFGKPITQIIHPQNLAAARDRIQRMMAGEKGLYPVEDRYLRLDGGEVPVEVMAVPLTYQGKPAVQVIIQDITERKQAEQALIDSRDRLAELSRRLVEAHEIERRAIGRELHDQIGQMLTALKLTIETAMRMPPEGALRKAVQGQEILDELLERVSHLSLELRPPMLDDLGLIPALLWYVNRYQDQTDIQVEFKHGGVEGRRFGSEIETTIYRIVQETLTNVARHARATHVHVGIHRDLVHKRGSGPIEIRIEDNGQGFDPRSALEQHRGLSGMRERVELVGGVFHIESEPGRGTRLFIEVPWSKVV